MSDPGPTPDPNPTPVPTPGERRLAHPPSDRYREAEIRAAADRAAPDPSASVARGVALAIAVAVVGAVAIVILGGLLTLTAGLLVAAAAIGWGVALSLRFGAGDRIAPRRRVAVALAIAMASVLAGQLGLWQNARMEGGVLPLLDYLGEVFGPLVPLQFAVAAVTAWIAAR